MRAILLASYHVLTFFRNGLDFIFFFLYNNATFLQIESYVYENVLGFLAVMSTAFFVLLACGQATKTTPSTEGQTLR